MCACVQHCDDVIFQEYDELPDKTRKTYYVELVMDSDEIMLVDEGTTKWKINLDKPMVSFISARRPESIEIVHVIVVDYEE